jgi:hypothetical protein
MPRQERHFRTERQPEPRPVRAQPEPVQVTPPAPPQMDIAKLDKVLWQRFEKRIRIEQERRGRG